jgi:SagB-type dehydrogenase family enzyme
VSIIGETERFDAQDSDNPLLQTWPAIRIDVNTLVCTKMPAGDQFQLPNATFVELLAKAAKGARHADLVEIASQHLSDSLENGAAAVAALLEAGLLVTADRLPDVSALEHWVNRGWLDALTLHCTTRNLSYADARTEDETLTDASLRKMIANDGLPEFWKQYPHAPTLALPPPAPLPDRSFEEVLLKRRSNRPWRGGGISLGVLSAVLQEANAQTLRLRSEASAQMLTRPSILLNSSYTALESYVVAFDVDGLSQGVYHYDLRSHGLVQIRLGDMAADYERLCIGQSRVRGASCAIIISSVWERFMYRYRHPRAYRTLLTNIGELAHKYLLLATAFEMSTFLTPAFEDEIAEDFIGVDGRTESPIYTVAFG